MNNMDSLIIITLFLTESEIDLLHIFLINNNFPYWHLLFQLEPFLASFDYLILIICIDF